MIHVALRRGAALLAAVVIAAMAIAAGFHHHGPWLDTASAEHPAMVGVSDEGPAACAVCAAVSTTGESALAAAPAPVPIPVAVVLDRACACGAAPLPSASPRSPPVLTAPAV